MYCIHTHAHTCTHVYVPVQYVTNCVWYQATWQGGWDVVTPGDVEISQSLMQLLHASPQEHQEIGNRLQLQRGHILQQKDQPCRQFHILLSVSCTNDTDNNQSCL